MTESDYEYLPEHCSRFATTRWSIVARAIRPNDPLARDALGELCQIYWKPVYIYVCHQGHDAEAALDLTQEFFARLLEKRDLGGACKERGRFRSYLLGAVNHFLSNQRARGKTLKRGGRAFILSIDQCDGEKQLPLDIPDPRTPEHSFNRKWAESLVESVLEALRSHYKKEGKEALFLQLQGLISADRETLPYRAIGEKLGLTEEAVKTAAHRLRKRYRERLKATVAETVENPADVEEEIRFLIQVLET